MKKLRKGKKIVSQATGFCAEIWMMDRQHMKQVCLPLDSVSQCLTILQDELNIYSDGHTSVFQFVATQCKYTGKWVGHNLCYKRQMNGSRNTTCITKRWQYRNSVRFSCRVLKDQHTTKWWATFRRFRRIAKSEYFLRHVCLFICLSVSSH